VKHVTVNWLMKQLDIGQNCNADEDTFLHMLTQIKGQNSADLLTGGDEGADQPAVEVTAAACNTESGLHVSEDDNDTSVTDWPHLFDLMDVDSNVVSYICRYMCMKVNKTSGCDECQHLFSEYRCSNAVHSAEFTDHEIFVHFKNFPWAKHGLQTPSPSLYSLFCSVEKVIQINMESCVNGQSGVAQ